jgi:hypothetical protein
MGKNKILFEICDFEDEKTKVVFGENLHISNISDRGFDWSIESVLLAMEIAYDRGIRFPKSDKDFIWDYKFNCIINGVMYNIHDTNNGMKINKL